MSVRKSKRISGAVDFSAARDESVSGDTSTVKRKSVRNANKESKSKTKPPIDQTVESEALSDSEFQVSKPTRTRKATNKSATEDTSTTRKKSTRNVNKESKIKTKSYVEQPTESEASSNSEFEFSGSTRTRKAANESVTESISTVRRKSVRNVNKESKSKPKSYVEQLIESEEEYNVESDEESEGESDEESSHSEFKFSKSTRTRKRKSNVEVNKTQSKKRQNIDKENGDSSNNFVGILAKGSAVRKVTQYIVENFESESSSSSDDENKAVNENSETIKPSVSPLTSDDEEMTESKPTELFDFSALVSQMTQATQEEKSEVDQTMKSEPEQTSATDSKKNKNKKTTPSKKAEVKTEQMEVFELLAMGEKTDMSAKDIKESVTKVQEEYQVPKQVEILLDTPTLKKKAKCDDLEMVLKRRLNNIRRENQVYIHKVHILCWIAHGIHVNRILNSPDILGTALSLLPSEKCYPSERMNIRYLEDLMNWFNKKVKLKKDPVSDARVDLIVSLKNQFEKQEANTKMDLCFMFIGMLRALGIKCRLIINLNVASMKPTSDQLLPVTQKKEEQTLEAAGGSKKVKTEGNVKEKEKSAKDGRKSSTKKNEKRGSESKNEKKSQDSKSKSEKKSEKTVKKEHKETRKSSRLTNSKSRYFEEVTSESSTSKRSRAKKSSPKKEKNYLDPFVQEMSGSESDDSENEFVSPKKKRKIDRKVISSDEEITTVERGNVSKPSRPSNKVNYWVEVYLEAEEKWASVDVSNKSFYCNEELYKNTAHPVRYILAWNNDQTIKDVTKRYVPQFLTLTRKLRVDEAWWNSTMNPYKPILTAQEKEENEELDKKLEEMPLPSSISEYKNHPLYALERHLLKFQAIYPPDAPPLGFIKSEPVYSRLCVHQLHGREMWIKEAKVVKLNEKPYKIVKGRQKKDKFGTGEGPRDLELFGIWQVEDYVPPTAENGKVPRNAFGNVELFKMSMLPKKTVYLQIPGLQRIANKLNIDCAAAITGFEYSTNGWSYPVKDGFVVCEEFKDILLDAYNQEVEEAEKKERQKREDRVYGNWKRLIRGLFIAEKLRRKYNFGGPTTSDAGEEGSSKKKDEAKSLK